VVCQRACHRQQWHDLLEQRRWKSVRDQSQRTTRNTVFTNLAIGAAYTPLSIGPDGKIYTQNDGRLFVTGN